MVALVATGKTGSARITPRSGLIAVVIAAAMLAAACGTGGGGGSPGLDEGAAPDVTTRTEDATTGTGSTPTSSSPREPAARSPENPGAPTSETREAILTLDRETLDGSHLDLDALAGREVLLWFWAPW